MRVAVLGLGFMGCTHARAIRAISGAELAAVACHNERRLAGDLSDLQGNLGGSQTTLDLEGVARYRRAEDAIADPAVEAVDICLPTDLHESMAIAALEAGKHVLVEKPMALDGAAADRMITAAIRQGRLLMVAHVLRFMPAYRMTAETVRSGRIGAVRAALFRRRCGTPAWSQWLADPARSGGGVFDLLIHDLDFCVYLFGTPAAVSARGYEDLAHGVDWIMAQLYYPGIGTVGVCGGWHQPAEYPFSMDFTLVGDGGTLEYSSAGTPLTLHSATGQQALELAETDAYRAEIEYFLGCAARGEEPAICPPGESAVTVKLARRMLESRAHDGERIACKF
jgi:predicted dehydrogenase